LEAADGIEAQCVGPERAEGLFHAWHAYQRLLRNETDNAEIAGWIDSANDMVPEAGRGERVRLFSTDGIRDPRNEKTELDSDYAVLHDLSAFPETFQAAEDEHLAPPSLEASVLEYQTVMRELEGRASFEHDLAAYP
jgi:hypothetical protein